MSIITFELKEEHIKLLKHLRWSVTEKKFIVSTENIDEDPAPFGENNIYDGIDLILNGRPTIFDPLNTDEIKEYSDAEKEFMDGLFNELPLALEVILYTNSFEKGLYKCKFHDRLWKKINN